MLTKSVRAIYKKSPAVIERIHPLALALCVLIATPIKKPITAVREDTKLKIRATAQCIPDLIKMT